MNWFLAIESATEVCSVSLYEGEKLQDTIEQKGSYSHAENLAVFCSEILEKNRLDSNSLTAIAFSAGPGSYTGLRIGLAFAKGLCYAKQIPLIAIDTLSALAAAAQSQIKDSKAFIAPMIDARRMEVYSAVFDSELNQKEKVQAKVIDSNSFLNFLQKDPVFFVGNGASKCQSIIESPNAHFEIQVNNTASSMGNLIQSKYEKQDFEDLAYYEPNYLKEFRAIKSKPLI